MFFGQKLRYQGEYGLIGHIPDTHIESIKTYFVIYTPPYSYIYRYIYIPQTFPNALEFYHAPTSLQAAMDTNRQLQDLSTTKTLNSEAPKPSTTLRQFSDSSTGIPWWEKKERLQCNVEELLQNLESISSFSHHCNFRLLTSDLSIKEKLMLGCLDMYTLMTIFASLEQHQMPSKHHTHIIVNQLQQIVSINASCLKQHRQQAQCSM